MNFANIANSDKFKFCIILKAWFKIWTEAVDIVIKDRVVTVVEIKVTIKTNQEDNPKIITQVVVADTKVQGIKLTKDQWVEFRTNLEIKWDRDKIIKISKDKEEITWELITIWVVVIKDNSWTNNSPEIIIIWDRD